MTQAPTKTLDYVLKRDGDSWVAHYSDFINLQESDAAFGKTPQEALQNFINSRVAATKCKHENTVPFGFIVICTDCKKGIGL